MLPLSMNVRPLTFPLLFLGRASIDDESKGEPLMSGGQVRKSRRIWVRYAFAQKGAPVYSRAIMNPRGSSGIDPGFQKLSSQPPIAPLHLLTDAEDLFLFQPQSGVGSPL